MKTNISNSQNYYFECTFFVVLDCVLFAVPFVPIAWQLPKRQLKKWVTAGPRSWSSVSLKTSCKKEKAKSKMPNKKKSLNVHFL